MLNTLFWVWVGVPRCFFANGSLHIQTITFVTVVSLFENIETRVGHTSVTGGEEEEEEEKRPCIGLLFAAKKMYIIFIKPTSLSLSLENLFKIRYFSVYPTFVMGGLD